MESTANFIVDYLSRINLIHALLIFGVTMTWAGAKLLLKQALLKLSEDTKRSTVNRTPTPMVTSTTAKTFRPRNRTLAVQMNRERNAGRRRTQGISI